jgi:hypothetical protein
MTVLNDEEVREFVERNEWNSGVKIVGGSLHYDDPEANALYIQFPETPLRATYFAWLASMLGAEEESMFCGALLWITLFQIGSPQLEKTGWATLEMMRRGFGENRPLEAASGHWFRDGAMVELTAFILQCFIFGWDAYVIPNRGDLFVHISHDKYWTVVTRNAETHEAALTLLNKINPQPGDQGLLKQFCPFSRHLQPTVEA